MTVLFHSASSSVDSSMLFLLEKACPSSLLYSFPLCKCTMIDAKTSFLSWKIMCGYLLKVFIVRKLHGKICSSPGDHKMTKSDNLPLLWPLWTIGHSWPCVSFDVFFSFVIMSFSTPVSLTASWVSFCFLSSICMFLEDELSSHP